MSDRYLFEALLELTPEDARPGLIRERIRQLRTETMLRAITLGVAAIGFSILVLFVILLPVIC